MIILCKYDIMVVHHCTNLSLHVCKDTKEKENKNERKQKNTAKIHLKENGKMSVEKLVKWAGKHFVFSMSKDMAYERIEEFLETQKDISDSMEKEIEKVLKEAESIYYRKKMYASVVNALDKPGEDFTEDDQQLIIKLLFELKKGINLEESIIKVANEELPKDENPEEKIKEIIKVSFDSEEGLLDFLKTI